MGVGFGCALETERVPSCSCDKEAVSEIEQQLSLVGARAAEGVHNCEHSFRWFARTVVLTVWTIKCTC